MYSNGLKSQKSTHIARLGYISAIAYWIFKREIYLVANYYQGYLELLVLSASI